MAVLQISAEQFEDEVIKAEGKVIVHTGDYRISSSIKSAVIKLAWMDEEIENKIKNAERKTIL